MAILRRKPPVRPPVAHKPPPKPKPKPPVPPMPHAPAPQPEPSAQMPEPMMTSASTTAPASAAATPAFELPAFFSSGPGPARQYDLSPAGGVGQEAPAEDTGSGG